MAELDLEEILRAVFDKTQRQRRNPARHPATTESALDEIPIAITGSTVPKLVYPQWGDWVLGDEVVEHFNNTGNTDIDLAFAVDGHTSESGHEWVMTTGTVEISTGDYAFRTGGVNALYTLERTADVRLTCTVIAGAGTGVGLLFRYNLGFNYWVFWAYNNDYRLYSVENASFVASGLGTPADGDVMKVEAVGDTIVCSVNNSSLVVMDDDYNNTELYCGLIFTSTSTARIKDFHAWNITGTSLSLATDPGHVVWGGPEAWLPGTEMAESVIQGSANLSAVGDFAVKEGEAAMSGSAEVTAAGVLS